MAHLALLYFTLTSLTSNILFSQASTSSPKPKALVLPIRQDAATKLLVANIYGRTPLIPISYVIDLNTRHVWANCESNYNSTTFSQPKCKSAQCKSAHTSYCFTNCQGARPFCHTNTCGYLLENPVSHQSTIGELAQDVIAFSSTNGKNPGPLVRIPDYLFTCAPSALVELRLPKGVQGVAGLAHAPIALQNVLTSRLGIKPIFTMCIPSTTSGDGVIFFGSDGPYSFLPGIDVSKSLKYTPLTFSPFDEYYIHVKNIKINQKPVPGLNTTLLSVNDTGSGGGTTFNTLLPYTILEGSTFKAITSFFAKQLSKVPQVKPIAPFGLCYESKHFSSTLLGPGVPSIDLELEGQNAVWSIFGLNSMVEAKPGVLCLAFVNGGIEYRANINIGLYQMKDIPMKFDLGKSVLGFGGPLSGIRTHCSNFNFTAVA
ncbi:basic 7S globulin 2-like [Chenopodium quinoa]|uniref:Peptidase A1 domain-containing protein n=1 Tax=Chenopodium quinoa TaxID=63459 RepID=A0A803LW79_CHEQI|nr:basic 7S globulin 2-like [Chenopodium quinoa]